MTSDVYESRSSLIPLLEVMLPTIVPHDGYATVVAASLTPLQAPELAAWHQARLDSMAEAVYYSNCAEQTDTGR